MKKRVKSKKQNNLRNIIFIVVIILIALFVLSIVYSNSKKRSFEDNGLGSYGPYESESITEPTTELITEPIEPSPDSTECKEFQKKCTANGKTICCNQGQTCDTTSSDAPKCISPCTDPAKPIECPTKNGMFCCSPTEMCQTDKNGNAKCVHQLQPPLGCPKDKKQCGISSTGQTGCCPEDYICAEKKYGDWTCCAQGTYYSPELDICVGFEETACKNKDQAFICKGSAGLLCCFDTKSCCPKDSECCYGDCCNTATAYCDKEAKVCKKKVVVVT